METEQLDRELLAVYLDDHWAGAGAGVQLAQRLARHQRGTRWEVPLQQVADGVQADAEALDAVRTELGVAGGQVKRALARIAERVSALKLNGRLLRRSPLSPLVECEALTAAIGAKHRLWVALGQMAHAYALAVPGQDFDDLAARSRKQLAALDRFHVEYAASAVRRETATRAG